jgi:hypothetical protein
MSRQALPQIVVVSRGVGVCAVPFNHT